MVNSCELTGVYTNWPNGPFYALSLPVKLMNERETFHLSLGGLKWLSMLLKSISGGSGETASLYREKTPGWNRFNLSSRRKARNPGGGCPG